jgi:lactoylglutathione lyase
MRSIAFALDPDGYWVEIIGQNPVDKTEGLKTTDLETYRMVR